MQDPFARSEERLPAVRPTVTRTAELAEAREILCGRYKPHELRQADTQRTFDFVHFAAQVPGGSVNILKYGSAVEIAPDPFGDFFMLEMPLRAGIDLEFDTCGHARSGDSTALFISPKMRFLSTWRADSLQIMLKLRAAEVLQRWRLLTGVPAAAVPEFGPEIDLRTPEGWRVQQLLLLLRREFQSAVTTPSGSMQATPLAGAAIDAVLAYFLATGHDGPGAPSPLPAALARCLGHVRRNLPGDLSTEALAAAAGTSERTLFALFRRHLDCTPQGFVRRERLEAARQLLQEPGTSVSEAARRVGFPHLGRFAGAYRAEFGESPSETRR